MKALDTRRLRDALDKTESTNVLLFIVLSIIALVAYFNNDIIFCKYTFAFVMVYGLLAYKNFASYITLTTRKGSEEYLPAPVIFYVETIAATVLYINSVAFLGIMPSIATAFTIIALAIPIGALIWTVGDMSLLWKEDITCAFDTTEAVDLSRAFFMFYENVTYLLIMVAIIAGIVLLY